MSMMAVVMRLLVAGPLIGLYGCENVALIGRPTIESRPPPTHISASVDGVDHAASEIYLRASSSQRYVVNYTERTRVLADGRDGDPQSLRVGDIVEVDVLQGPDKRLYAERIRIEKRGEFASGSSAIRTVEGTVESVSPERGVIELRIASGDLLTVYVPPSANTAIRDRLRRIRAGDRIRLEGERLGENRLELLAFR
jgi:hypothetical protein